MKTTFSRYTPAAVQRLQPHVTLRQILRVPDLIARAEHSGSEACYVEVARWSALRQRWERFAFEKFFGGELWRNLNAGDTCERLADIINRRAGTHRCSFIHNLPSFNTPVNHDHDL